MEEINTGGLRKIVHPKGYKPELEPELADKIEEGYRKAEERKKREKIIKIGVAAGIILILIILFIIL